MLLKRVVFVAGVGNKCGSTFLSRALDEHSHITRAVGNLELPLLRAGPAYITFHQAFAATQKAHRQTFDRSKMMDCLGRGIVHESCDRLLHKPDAPYLLYKYPQIWGAEYFFDFFPTGTLILLTRDGRDLVNSQMAIASEVAGKSWMLKRRLVLAKLAHRWSRSMETVRHIVERHPSRVVLMRFEDLIAHPTHELTRIANAMGIDADTEWFRRVSALPVTGSTHYRPTDAGVTERAGVADWSGTPVTSGFKPIGRWKKNWTKLDQAVFNLFARTEMAQAGYY